jgi:ABC-2 type transport system permease protein
MAAPALELPGKPLADERESLGEELRTVGMVWEREAIRFFRTRSRVLSSFIQPVLFLFVLGYGMSTLVGTTAGFDFKKFLFPGIVAMTVMSTTLSSAISIVWDREFGFLREMLVAPVSRMSLVSGKTLGGASIATVQGTIMLVLAPLIGVFVASHIQRMEGFSVVMQLLLFPMLFLSGALFPLNGLPSWLTVLTRLNPLTYAVAPLRVIVFAAQHMSPAVAAEFSSTVTLFGATLSNAADIGITCLFGVVFLALAVRGFGKTE